MKVQTSGVIGRIFRIFQGQLVVVCDINVTRPWSEVLYLSSCDPKSLSKRSMVGPMKVRSNVQFPLLMQVLTLVTGVC